MNTHSRWSKIEFKWVFYSIRIDILCQKYSGFFLRNIVDEQKTTLVDKNVSLKIRMISIL